MHSTNLSILKSICKLWYMLNTLLNYNTILVVRVSGSRWIGDSFDYLLKLHFANFTTFLLPVEWAKWSKRLSVLCGFQFFGQDLSWLCDFSYAVFRIQLRRQHNISLDSLDLNFRPILCWGKWDKDKGKN